MCGMACHACFCMPPAVGRTVLVWLQIRVGCFGACKVRPHARPWLQVLAGVCWRSHTSTQQYQKYAILSTSSNAASGRWPLGLLPQQACLREGRLSCPCWLKGVCAFVEKGVCCVLIPGHICGLYVQLGPPTVFIDIVTATWSGEDPNQARHVYVTYPCYIGSLHWLIIPRYKMGPLGWLWECARGAICKVYYSYSIPCYECYLEWCQYCIMSAAYSIIQHELVRL
jgi:hypothetical protein